jgi:hypothetical protein
MLYSWATDQRNIEREVVMRGKMQIAVFTFITSASIAQAAASSTGAGVTPMMVLFIAFAAAIIVVQLIPGMILLGSMLKGIFTLGKNPAAPRTIEE